MLQNYPNTMLNGTESFVENKIYNSPQDVQVFLNAWRSLQACIGGVGRHLHIISSSNIVGTATNISTVMKLDRNVANEVSKIEDLVRRLRANDYKVLAGTDLSIMVKEVNSLAQQIQSSFKSHRNRIEKQVTERKERKPDFTPAQLWNGCHAQLSQLARLLNNRAAIDSGVSVNGISVFCRVLRTEAKQTISSRTENALHELWRNRSSQFLDKEEIKRLKELRKAVKSELSNIIKAIVQARPRIKPDSQTKFPGLREEIEKIEKQTRMRPANS